MKVTKKDSGFVPHPETEQPVRGVIVDVTPLKEMTSQFGTQQVFKLVFESEVMNEEADPPQPFAVWSRPYTPSLHEKANFRKDLKRILGRDLSAQEEEEFETEDLIGVPVTMMIEHAHGDKGTFANISLLTAHKGKNPLKPSGKFVRAKDREKKDDGGNAYRRAAPADAEADGAKAGQAGGREEWQKVKVHVGRHAGVDLGDLPEDAVQKLIENWLPGCRQNAKPTAADKRLAGALETIEQGLAAMATAGEEEMPY